MTKDEAAIVSAYTGVMLGKFSDMQQYAERVMGRPLWTHEFASQDVVDELKAATRPDFMALEVI